MKQWNKRKSVDQSENFRWNKHTPFLASPMCIEQAQRGEDKTYKERKQDGLRPLLWGRPTLTPRGCTILCLPNKTLSCNRVVKKKKKKKNWSSKDALLYDFMTRSSSTDRQNLLSGTEIKTMVPSRELKEGLIGKGLEETFWVIKIFNSS